MKLLTKEEIIKEMDFISDAEKFYTSKQCRPSLPSLIANYNHLRKKTDFEENDFIESSNLSFAMAQNIYFIGISEYHTNLTFEQFLYYTFWKNPTNDKPVNNYKPYYQPRFNFTAKTFRKKLKFQQHGVNKKTKNPTKEDWREFKKFTRDKQKYASRRSPWSKLYRAKDIEKRLAPLADD